ncbi:MAG TPA: glycosyltransferase family 9 protein [Bdellovibrionales bacterium]|nr:glycosyltransferase family 9 protein [Bdellovibrionales bacterium]
MRRLQKGPLELVCRKGFGAFMRETGLADKVYEVEKSNAASYASLARELGARDFELLVSPHQSLRSALFARKIRAQRKLGFKTWWNGLVFGDRIERPMHLPDALRQLSALAPADPELRELLSAAQTSFHNRAPLFEPVDLQQIPEWASMRVERFARKPLAKRARRIVLAPGSQWATKRWTPEGFRRVGLAFKESGYEIALAGSAPEKPICAEIAAGIPGAVDLCGRTSLIELAELFGDSALLIVNDSGLMHMGAVAEIPTVAVFGPTTLELGYRPWQPKALVVESELPCRPCGKHGHQVCPIGTHACMKQIQSDSVLQLARKLLAVA